MIGIVDEEDIQKAIAVDQVHLQAIQGAQDIQNQTESRTTALVTNLQTDTKAGLLKESSTVLAQFLSITLHQSPSIAQHQGPSIAPTCPKSINQFINL